VSAGSPGRRYEIALLLLLTLANGVVAFDRLAASFISPQIVAELKLNNTQLGLMAGALSGAVALTSWFGGQIADRTGQRKALLVLCTVVFSLGSAAGGLAAGFVTLLAARFLLGLAEGPMVPISQTVMAETAAPEQRGLSMGFMQMAGAFGIGGILGPILATWVAEQWGWRNVFYLSALPGLGLALAIAWLMRPEPARTIERPKTPPLGASLATLFKIRNMRVALSVAVLFTAWLVLQNTFLAVYLTSTKGLDPMTMGKVISMGGIAGVIGGTLLPYLSDRIGRRPVVIGACLAGILAPALLLLLPGDPLLLGGAVLLGWLPLGIAPLYCATIPTESVPSGLSTSAVGLSMGMAELLGGVAAPLLAGLAADAWGLQAVFWICMALALSAAAVGVLLKETAPGKRSVNLESAHA
jgi:MFS family permease